MICVGDLHAAKASPHAARPTTTTILRIAPGLSRNTPTRYTSPCQARARVREAKVPPELNGSALDAAVRGVFELSWGKAREQIQRGKIRLDGVVTDDPLVRTREGQTLVLDPAARKIRPNELPREAIVYQDKHIVVVQKPAGIATVPFDPEGMGASIAKREGPRGEKTLDVMVKTTVGADIGVVHRIDKDTSGLLVFTKSWAAKKELMNAFRVHAVHRRYLAIAHGKVATYTYQTNLVQNRGDGLRGSIEHRGGRKKAVGNEMSQLAITHVEELEALDGATLIACRLETGRTHQIRIHLSEDGHPLVGEKVYIRGFKGPVIKAPRLMLHAAELGFTHPISGEAMMWKSDLPDDMKRVYDALRPGR